MTRSKIRTTGAEGLTLSSTSLTVANGLTLTDGDIALASGHGVSFSATSDASGMQNELLDDYEEGTWTPTMRFGGSDSGMGYSEQVGRYTKIGNIVHLKGRILLASRGSNSGTVTIHGSPFTPADDFGSVSYEYLIDFLFHSFNDAQIRCIGHFDDSGIINMHRIRTTNVTSTFNDDIDNTNLADNTDLRFSVTFKAA